MFPRLSVKAIKGLAYALPEKLFQIKVFENPGNEETLKLLSENNYSVNLVKDTKFRNDEFENLINDIERVSDDLSTRDDWFKVIESLAKAMILSLEIDKAELKQRFKENSQSINKTLEN